MSVDVVTLAVVRGALDTVALEMDSTLTAAAFSMIIAEGRDYANGIYHAKTGEVIAQGKEGLPTFMGVMQFSLQKSLEEIDVNDLGPGDIYIVNDVYVGGTHLPDVRLFKPYFYKDRLYLFLSNTGHWWDIGGGVAGGMNPYATEIFQEGLRIPPVKLYNRGKLDQDIVSLIMRNVRTPREDYGDLMAQVKALRVGENRLNELFDKYGPQMLMECLDEFKTRADRLMRSRIREIPDGVYTFSDFMDNDGVENKPLVINLRIDVREGTIHFDFTGTAESRPSYANIVETTTKTSCFLTMKHVFPEIPVNSGCFEPFSFTIPEGIFLNAKPPHATAFNPEIMQRISDVVFGALAKAIPDRVYAAAYSTSNIIAMWGNDPLRGRFIWNAFWGGGLGGHAKGDGLTNGVSAPTSARTQSIEVNEHRYPLLFKRFETREGSAGAGKYRGGLGTVYEVELFRGEATCINTGDRGIGAPYGIKGGKEAKKTEITYYLNGKEFTPPMVSKASGIKIKAGDRILVKTPGGGGYGHPFERDPGLVLRDVKEGYITTQSARKDYGVSIVKREGKYTANYKKTNQLRQHTSLTK